MSFEKLPFRVILRVTQDWYQLRIVFDDYEHPNIEKLFFGYFSEDKTRKIFCIFSSIYVEQNQIMKSYDPPVLKLLPARELKSVEFNIIYSSYVSIRFLEKAKRLESLERVIFDEVMMNNCVLHILNLEKFMFAISELTNEFMTHLEKLEKLNFLGYKLIARKGIKGLRTTKDLEIKTLKKIYINYCLPKSFTFSKCSELQLLHISHGEVSNIHIYHLSRHPSLRELILDRCNVENRMDRLFQSRSLRRICICWCNMTISRDYNLKIEEPSKSQLEAIEFEMVSELGEHFQFWSEFLKLESLRRLFLNNCDNIGDEFLRNIIEKKEEVRWKKGFFLQISTSSVLLSQEMEEMFKKEFPNFVVKIFRKRK